MGKMSKSKYSVINPDDICARYGVDCFRMYEMFFGPIDQAKANTDVQKYLEGKTIRKVIVVPKRMVNFVVG